VSLSGGGNGGAAAPFWHWGGAARLGEGRGAEWEGGTPFGEANGEGELGREGGIEEGSRGACAASRWRARRAAIMAGQGSSGEEWGRQWRVVMKAGRGA
jgi:hypothetical protein